MLVTLCGSAFIRAPLYFDKELSLRDDPHVPVPGQLAARALAGAVMGGCSAAPLPRTLPEGPWRGRLRALPTENLHAVRQEGLVASHRPHPRTRARRPVGARRRRRRQRPPGRGRRPRR